MVFNVKSSNFYDLWHPFCRPLEEIYDEMVEREVDRRVKKELRLKEIEEEVRGMEMKRR